MSKGATRGPAPYVKESDRPLRPGRSGRVTAKSHLAGSAVCRSRAGLPGEPHAQAARKGQPMRERWHDPEPDWPGWPDPPADPVRPAAARGSLPAPGGPARLQAASGRPQAASGLRWPPADSWWPGSRPGIGPGSGSGPGDGPDAATTLDSDPGAAAGGLDWLLADPPVAPLRGENAPFSRADGAPAASMPGVGGRFAAEWWPAGASSRPDSLDRERGRRAKTDGGVMVRRALLERSDQLTADDDEALPPLRPQSARAGHTAAPWRGSGGRWLVWVARAVAWAVLLLIGYRGVLAIVEGTGTTPPAATPASAPPSAGSQFPVTAAEAYALEFGDVYLNFSPSTAAARSRDLASFVAPGADSQLGWNGAGSQRVFDEQVSAIRVTGAHTAVVTLLARVSGGRLIELGVPVYAAGGGLTVSGNPALLPGPARAVQPAASRLRTRPPRPNCRVSSRPSLRRMAAATRRRWPGSPLPERTSAASAAA